MRKLYGCLCVCLVLSACATLPAEKTCPVNWQRTSFFAQEEQLAAFDVRAFVKGNEWDGILQIKKIEPDRYDIQVFAKWGGYRLLQAEISSQKIQYKFLIKEADRAAVKAKLNRLFRLLLFSSPAFDACRFTQQGYLIKYRKPYPIYYLYTNAASYPVHAYYQKVGKDARLDFQHYTDHGIADQLVYQDGSVKLQLQLIRLKK